MFYSLELRFLCDVLEKSRINISFVSPKDSVSRVIDQSFLSVLENLGVTDTPISNFLGDIAQNTVYKTTDSFNLCYIFFLLPEMPEETVFFIGPYVHTALISNQILEICEKNNILPQNQKMLIDYYSSIPVISEDSHLFVMMDSFYERLWGKNNFTVVDIAHENETLIPTINSQNASNLEESLINIELMEKRYNYENELMQAVTLGQIHKVDLLFSGFNELSFEKRVADPLRNMKNYCIIMNTLFRKAAEKGGVRPIYLDRVSSSFAVQIEQVSNVSQISVLMRKIFRSYCRLVHKHSTKDYSPIVQKTIIFIESDLSANLTLNALAKVQNVSGGYLSSIFKKETGKTVTEYIREKRMKYATHLLATTNLQIQTVALHCGIMDLQYFSKQFKRHIGMTPKEYRESVK